MQTWQIVGVTVVFVVAGGVKGITGMGLPTVAVSLLGLWMAPAEAAALLLLPSLATNIAQCRGPHLARLVRLLWPAWLGLALATLLAPGLGDQADAGRDARRLLGAVLLLYGAWGLGRPSLPALAPGSARSSALQGLVVGGVTGVVSALTAVFVLPLVPWLQTLRLQKEALVQALGLSFAVATLALAVRLQASSEGLQFSAMTMLALVAAFEGLWLGSMLRARLSGPAFQRALFVVFIGLGLANLLHGA